VRDGEHDRLAHRTHERDDQRPKDEENEEQHNGAERAPRSLRG